MRLRRSGRQLNVDLLIDADDKESVEYENGNEYEYENYNYYDCNCDCDKEADDDYGDEDYENDENNVRQTYVKKINMMVEGIGRRINWRRQRIRLRRKGLSSSKSSSHHTFNSFSSITTSPHCFSPFTLVIFCLFLILSGPCGVHSRHQLDDSSEEVWSNGKGNGSDVGLTPPVFNLARHASITANGTCGENGEETYCKITEHVHPRDRTRPSQCGVCNADSHDKSKRHPIRYAIDESNRWWQSPTLNNGRQYEWITIKIDLKKVYQVAYLIIKAGPSPRPGNWILERSKDGVDFLPWQYFAISDDECLIRYGIVARPGKPSYTDDDEVICTSFFSKITPFEGGEIHISLVHGRPGAQHMSEKLTKFTMAQFIRLRLQKIRTLNADLMTVGGPESRSWDTSVMRRYFYSIKDIAIGGSCVCFGHARECVTSDDGSTPTARCMCQHNTCGDNCDVCCPLYNQYQWGPGNSTDSAACEECQCYGHADSCVYDPEIHEKNLSINTFGTPDGGGVCLDCKAHTTGINCEKCQDGYYRPLGIPLDDPAPCVKCNCSSLGSLGYCVPSEIEAASFGKSPGDCICKEGFAGRNCDRCARGFRNYPTCEPCPCNVAGIVNVECDGDCICKENVEGTLCNACKIGFFNLDHRNPRGCTQCFCHGVSTQCTSANFAVVEMRDMDKWFVTDLHGTKIVRAPASNGVYSVANEEFASYNAYYWTVGDAYSGKRIHSYGLNITFHVAWVQARGDSSGRPVPDFDVIIQSTNSMLAFNYVSYDGDNSTIQVTLNEFNCFVLPDVDNNVIQTVVSSSHSRPHPGIPCSRFDVMEGLSDVKRLLLRAKFHTDQIEGMLHWAVLEQADPSQQRLPGDSLSSSSVEICSCPKGYAGTSCEECGYSYRKSSRDSWRNECIKCDCNGHSPTCDFEGNCQICEHNTTGARCDKCVDGYYGDPSTESIHSCKPCECPLSIASNNFSPTCSLSGNSYVCTACPVGYEGDNCERCSNGFYGNPSHPGDYCKPCNCNSDLASNNNDASSNICDHLTGECLVCPKYAVGWNCEECLTGYFGDPINGTCKPCECNPTGSLNANCDQDTGKCYCRQYFDGDKCDVCIEGHGGPEEGCPSCDCNNLGSSSHICDQVTGQCPCKSGIGGRYCNKCLDLHFGFGFSGCTPCGCHPDGSDSSLCDLKTGQCHCLPHVEGRKCEVCSVGYWNIASGAGCEPCNCGNGSMQQSCDVETGQCACRQGIGGLNCDQCLPKHYGLTADGCRECDPCDKPGYICDPHDGKCVCPPNTEGAVCEKCHVGSWGHHPVHGCQECNCSQHGSTTPQCSPETGRCNCVLGYDSDKCSVCKFGYYNYPHCTPCECDSAGTEPEFCDSNGVCSCSSTGTCKCKENVVGQKCNRCKEGTYGLDIASPEGCMECFCFQRTNRCSQGYFKWERLALPTDRNIEIRTGQIDNQLKSINNLIVIPDTSETIFIENDISFGAPLYWQLPHIFLGDKVLSYNGYLRFHQGSTSTSSSFPPSVLSSYPLVQIQGNHKLVLEYYPEGRASSNGFHEVRLHEDLWRLKNGPNEGQVSKEVMMVALQNLQHILIRATNAPEVFNVTFFNVSLDIAIPNNAADNSMAHGIEVCECPPEYNSTSCQNPKLGYYRWYKREFITSTVIIDLIGQAKPCECNGRADVCDTESGNCVNCSNNTAGPYCNICAPGYYGDPFDKCLPCPCPSIWNNFADACYHQPEPPEPGNGLITGGSTTTSQQFHCFCKNGYTGKSCERCDYGFFGKPWEPQGMCESCRCNKYGSVSDECHEITGQCNCRPGVTGRDCSRCSSRHVIIGKMCTSCDDQCTGVLLNDVDQIASDLSQLTITPDVAAVWRKLLSFEMEASALMKKVNGLNSLVIFVDDLPTYSNLAKILLVRIQELRKLSLDDVHLQTFELATKSEDILGKINLITNDIRGTVLSLEDYIHGKLYPTVSVESAKIEARNILDSMEPIDFAQIQQEVQLELDNANELSESVISSVYNSTLTGNILRQMNSLRDKLEDLMNHLSFAEKNTLKAQEIYFEGKQLFLTAQHNLELVDNMTIDMDVDTLMTSDKLSEGGHAFTEIDQVLLMIEDLMKDLRNSTKEVEIRDNNLFDLVPLYRVQYAQPAFDHVEMLKRKAKHLQSIFRSIQVNGSESLNALTAYQRIKEGYEKAFELASNASKYSNETSAKIKAFLEAYSIENILETSSDLIQQGLTLSGIVETAMRGNLEGFKSDMDGLTWKIRVTNESLRSLFNQMEVFDENLRLEELVDRVQEIADSVNETSMDVMDMETKIQNELKAKVDAIKGGASLSAVDLTIQVNNLQANISRSSETESRVESKRRIMNVKMDDVDDRMRKLRALITQSRHKADTVRVSIGPDETGTCFRLYKWPTIDDATSIRFNFAPTKYSDSLLFYWPSSLNDDYISIEMVDLRIKASWDLGSGLRTLIHPRNFTAISENSDDPDHWVQISLERVGSAVSLDVRPIDDVNGQSTSISYKNDEDEATLLNLSPDDLIHIGAMSKQMRAGLVTNGLSGCLHKLEVNDRSVGLWNFVGNEGCGPCTECLEATDIIPSPDLEFYFDGRGYALVNRIQSKIFNPNFFDISLEFKTFSETALLFLTVNERIGQMISLELREGTVVFQARHGWEVGLKIESSGVKHNTGEWVKLRAIWVYQNGLQTGQLSVGKNNYKELKKSVGQSLELSEATYQIGGLTPAFNPTKWQERVTIVPFVGCMKKILIDSSSYDLMSGLHFGVESSCSGKTVHLASFEGDGYGEFPSLSMGKDFVLGLSFKTLSPTGVILLSTFARTGNTSPAEPYYAIYLENGKIRVQFGVAHGPTDLAANDTRYDDGKFHSFRLVKKNRRVIVYMDDVEVGETRLPKKSPTVAAPDHGGLFIGGMSESVLQKFLDSPLTITRGFAGCIQNIYFGKRLLNFNYPITYKNHNMGQCPSHFNFDSSSIPSQYLYPATVHSDLIRYERPYADHSCLSSQRLIEQEDPQKALHFGDTPDSYATISLEGSKSLRQNFNLTFGFRTFYPNGLFFKGVKRKGNNGHCLTSYLKDGQIVVKVFGDRTQDLLSQVTNLNDGSWHQVTIVKAEDKMYLYVDFVNMTVTKVPKLKTISKLFIGGSPSSGHDCFENLILKPDYFKGCIKNLIVNSHTFNLDTHNALLHRVSPCFREVQSGTFFKPGGFAIYSHNFTLGNLIELELEFRSDARNGVLLSFIPNSSNKYPTFAIFLEDGQVVARETVSSGALGSHEARQEFSSDPGYVCNNKWHSIKANYENGAITLRVDSLQPIYAVRVNGNGHGHFFSGSLYIGGLEADGASRPTKKSQFHGCVRNISINRQRKDWTDMALLSNVFINACPV